jgi:hypothetical protein
MQRENMESVNMTKPAFYDAFNLIGPSAAVDRVQQTVEAMRADERNVGPVRRISGGRLYWLGETVRQPVEAPLELTAVPVVAGSLNCECTVTDPTWYERSEAKLDAVRRRMTGEDGGELLIANPGPEMVEWLDSGFAAAKSRGLPERENTASPSVDDIASVFATEDVVQFYDETSTHIGLTRPLKPPTGLRFSPVGPSFHDRFG